jgi:hypothetical protein
MKPGLLFALLGLLAVDASAQSTSTTIAGRNVRPAPAAAPTASDPTQPSRVPVKRLALSDERYSRLYFDSDNAGAAWVRGRAYKARFDASGATLFPFMGSDAPRHYPVAMSLESASAGGVPIALLPGTGAVRDGANVTIDRGPVDEVYELGVEQIEQTFVIDSLPAEGDVVLRVRVSTELARSELADGFRFANERGHVSYGRASVRGAQGDLTGVPTSFVDGAVEILVPADVVAQAGLPLVVDPVISVFTIDSYHDQFAPDVAYDASNDVYLEIEEERFTAADSDSYSVRLSAAGAYAGSNYADLTTADWRAPRVANLNAYDQFLVVASINDGSTAFGQRFIGGRETPAASVTFGPMFPISNTGMLGNMYNVDVGGDPYGSPPAYYCVAWQLDTAIVPQTKEVLYRMVTNTGTTSGGQAGLTTVPNTIDEVPSVSNGNGGATWTIAWQRRPISTQHYEIWAARVNWNGPLTDPAFLVATGFNRMYGPSAASPFLDGNYAVAYLEDWTTDRDVRVAVGTVGSGFTHTNVSNFDSSYLEDQHHVCADSDGNTLALAFSESPDGSGTQPSDLFACNLYRSTPGASMLGIVENRAVIEEGAPNATAPLMCSTQATAGAPRRYMIVFDQAATIGANRTAKGALYDGVDAGDITSVCAGDGSATACPCGNTGAAGHGCGNSVDASGALLAGSGTATTSGDTVSMTASGMPATASCLFFQGTTIPGAGLGAVFGDGLRCAGGSVVRLKIATASGGASTFPAAGDPPVSVKGLVPATGGLRVYQVWYRNSAAFCSPSLFNLTNGLKILWVP